MLRFLTDEDFDGRLTAALFARLPGLDLVRVQDVGLMRTPDPDVLSWAAAQGRILLTHHRNTMTGFATARISAGQQMRDSSSWTNKHLPAGFSTIWK